MPLGNTAGIVCRKMETREESRILLIVEDRVDVGRAFARYFRRHFESVLLAATPIEAEALLEGDPPPTHVLCDHWLGDEYPVGTVLLPRWRLHYPHLRRAVLVSGSEIEEIQPPEGVDAVFAKPADMAAICESLLVA